MADHSAVGERLPLPAGVPAPWLEEEDADHHWTRDRVHAPHQMTVLDYDFWFRFIDNGIGYAARLYSLPYRYRSRRFWTRYYCEETEDGDVSHGPSPVLDTIAAEFGDRWAESWLPEIRTFSDYLFGLDLDAASDDELVTYLDGAVRRLRRAWEVHFESTIASGHVMTRYQTLFTELFEGATNRDAAKLLAAFPNQTTAAGHALWRLRDRAATIPGVAEAFELPDEEVLNALAAVPEAAGFLDGFRAYLEQFCRRPPYVTISERTFAEEPRSVISQLRDALNHPERDPEQHRAALALERDTAIEAARTALADHPTPVREEFERVLALAQSAMRYKEDHAFYIDFQLTAAARRVPVEVGKRMAAAGVLGSADDVIHLTFDELRSTLTGRPWPDRRAMVADRKAELSRFASFEPPLELGTRPVPDGSVDAAPSAAAPVEEPGVLRGTPVSGGTGRGRARVVALLDEARELRPGEVLVAPSTAQPWTPLFATAAGLVTETGGVLSHAAIVVRGQEPAIVWLGEVGSTEPTLVGLKTAHLSDLSHPFPVPDGFCVTTTAYRSSRGSLAAHPALVASITDAYLRLAGTGGGVAVRSSAVDEDGDAASFAGQLTSTLNVEGVDALIAAIETTWRSGASESVMTYRRSHGLGATPAPVAVLVQRLVRADCSGVAFSIDPVSGDNTLIVVNATWGLGESLVNGAIEPDRLVADKATLTLVSERMGAKERMTIPTAGGVRDVTTPSFLRARAALTTDQRAAVFALARDLETRLGRPVDVEFAFGPDGLSLLQCRAVTTGALGEAQRPESGVDGRGVDGAVDGEA